ncbi:hypothetical protein [Oscillibacter sp.]|uniref:hypothetical protein n=1 Tax=Oscillibacter sp. TaxID=1945593 RepID=UPI002D80630F|nr:hypothetical protein [Oscillibacter sp.]
MNTLEKARLKNRAFSFAQKGRPAIPEAILPDCLCGDESKGLVSFKNPPPLRPCLKIAGMSNGEEFLRWARRFSAGIPTDFKGGAAVCRAAGLPPAGGTSRTCGFSCGLSPLSTPNFGVHKFVKFLYFLKIDRFLSNKVQKSTS